MTGKGRKKSGGDGGGRRFWSRRDFLTVAGGLGAGVLAGGAAWAWDGVEQVASGGPNDRFPLRMPSELAPRDIVLRAAPGEWDMGSRRGVPGWLVNGECPSPLLRVRRGDEFRVTLRNEIPDPLILHWHGMTPPEEMDGHPRFAIAPGERYDYRFRVDDRAGMYWYHSHTDGRTGIHAYRGIAGVILVEDPDEAVELPSGERELPLIFQDRQFDRSGMPVYPTMGPAMMTGVMGEEPFANGIHRAYHEVETAVYRLRVLNGSTTRILRLGRSDGVPLTLIGGDRGLLGRPTSLPWVELGPAERADLLVDLRSAEIGDRIMLRSLEFEIPGGTGGMMGGGGPGGRGGPPGGRGPGGRRGGRRGMPGMMGMMGAVDLQGRPLDLLELRVTGRADDPGFIPEALPAPPAGPDPADAENQRRFVFTSEHMRHLINGRTFRMDRIDERVPFGRTEIWTFVNDSFLPHPVHLHATHFRVLERTGGRGRVLPWEAGLKDTSVVYPGETVRVAVRFSAQRGLFLLHCHNLMHEDRGMMQNILVEG